MRQFTLHSALIFLLLFTVSIQAQQTDLLYVTAVAWSHDGSKIAAVGIRQPATQGYLRVIDVETGQILYAADPAPGGFTSVNWSSDDRFIAMGGYDQTIRVIDLEVGNQVATLWGHQSTVTAIDWNSDNTSLVSSGNWDGFTILWDMNTYEQSRIVEESSVFPVDVAFSPDDQFIAIAGELGIRIRASTAEDAVPQWYFPDRNLGSFVWSHNGDRIALGTQVFQSIANPDQQIFARLYILDSSNGDQIGGFSTETESIYGLAWSPDDQLLATSSIDGFVKVWDVKTESLLGSFVGVTNYPSDVGFSSFGGRLAYGSMVSGETAIMGTTILNSAVQIVVPDSSLERLQSIANLCDAPLTIPTQADQLSELISQIEALPVETIPAACAADLIAVAEAIQGGE